MNVFVLELTNGKYFIGHTYKSNFKLSELNSDKLEWTRKYKPVGIIDFLENCTFDYYLKIINVYMDFYGVKNVYSGAEFNIDYWNEFVVFEDPSITHEKMDADKEKFIKDDIIKTRENSCVLCGKIDHIISECESLDNIESKL